MRNRFIASTLLLVLLLSCTVTRSSADDAPTERGTFRLHKFMQAIGSESYEIARQGESVLLTSTFEFSDRGTKVPLTTTLRAAADLTPTHFEIKGKTSRISSIDTTIDVASGSATIAESGASRTEAVSGPYFVSAGYAPVALQMALMRYWLAHGKPATLRTVPVGEVTIADRGVDTIEVGGKRAALRRYSVDGLLWGREWLWLDEHANLVALVSIDAEFDHFEAIREGFEAALDRFVALAAADGMAQLADFARGLSKDHTAGSSHSLAIVGATLVDGTGRAPISDSVVVLHDDRIVAAGPRSTTKVPKDARTIDGRGKWIIPGLWDMHAHFQQVEWGPIYLAAGVTTARDCANEFEFITSVRDSIEAGRGLGPRLVLAGIVDSDSPMALGVTRINTPADVPGVVARYKKAGFRQIKLYQSVKPELVPLIAAEAHKAGLSVTGHVPNGMTATQGIAAGMDQINHLNFVADEMMPNLFRLPPAEATKALREFSFSSPEAQRVIGELVKHHTVVDPTIALREWIWHPRSVPFETLEPGVKMLPQPLALALSGTGVSDERAEFTSVALAKMLELIGVLHRAGIPIVAGTDQTVPGHSLHREIELYVRAGLTPMEALQSATIVPARALGLDRESGTVEAGKLADLVLLDADPLASIANTRRIDRVVARGVVYDPTPLWRVAGFRP